MTKQNEIIHMKNFFKTNIYIFYVLMNMVLFCLDIKAH